MATTRPPKPTIRTILHAELARLREAAGWSLADLAEQTTYDRSYLHKLEKGEKLGSETAIAALDRAYGTSPLLGQLWLLAKDDVVPNKYRRFMGLQAQARVIQAFYVSTIPGLLQTKRYAEAQLRTARPRSEEWLAEQVAFRMSRQEILYGIDPTHLRCLLDESVLRRAPRDREVWREQLERLLKDAELSNISIQVVPFSAGLHDLLGGSLSLLWLPGGKSAAYVESSKGADLIEDAEEVEQLKLSYDLLRDSALSPAESLKLIRDAMEESTPCASPEPT